MASFLGAAPLLEFSYYAYLGALQVCFKVRKGGFHFKADTSFLRPFSCRSNAGTLGKTSPKISFGPLKSHFIVTYCQNNLKCDTYFRLSNCYIQRNVIKKGSPLLRFVRQSDFLTLTIITLKT